MGFQDSINSGISTVAYASAAHGLLTNQQAQMRATVKLSDELKSINSYKEKIKNKFGIELSNTEARILGKTKLSNRNFRTLLQPIDGVVEGD